MRLREQKKDSTNPSKNGLFIPPKVQRKLKVGEANDKYEQEADQVADKVVSQSNSDSVQKKEGEEEVQKKAVANEVTPLVQKAAVEDEQPVQKAEQEETVQKTEEEEAVQKAAAEEESIQKEEDEVQMKAEGEEEVVQKAEEEEAVQKSEEEEQVQGKNAATSGTTASSSIEQRINHSKGSGNKLKGKTKREMESGFGSDFSKVNIHNDDQAAQLSQDLGAKAFTHGNDIYFNSGEYNPDSSEGKRLLAHELTHTIQQKGTVQKAEEEAPNPRIELGKKILGSMSRGLTVIFYEIDDNVFKGDAEKWAKTHGAIGISGNQISAETVEFGKAIPERLVLKDVDDKKRTLAIGQVITELGQLVESCVREAFLELNGHEIDNETRNLAKFKTVGLGSHGWDGNTSLDINSSNIQGFLETTSPYLRNDINLIFYACTVSKNSDEEYDQWMKVYNEDGGEDSLTAAARDKLADLGHTEGVVWGHTAVGHFLKNYTLRRFKVSDKGEAGESYLVYCFRDEINTMVADIVTLLQNDEAYTGTIDEAKIIEIWNAVYEKTKSDFRACYAKANNTLTISVGGQEKTLAEEAPLYPEEVKKMILDFRTTKWTKGFDPATVKTAIIKKLKK